MLNVILGAKMRYLIKHMAQKRKSMHPLRPGPHSKVVELNLKAS